MKVLPQSTRPRLFEDVALLPFRPMLDLLLDEVKGRHLCISLHLGYFVAASFGTGD